MCLEVSLKTGVDSIPLKLLNYSVPFVPFKFLAQYKLKIFPLIKYPIIQFPPNFFRIILQKKNQWENRNMEQSAPKSTDPLTCENLPHLLSSFVDTFVDFSVSGLFFPKQNPNSNFSNDAVHSPPLQTVYPSPERLIAIGDLHGDLFKTKEALRLAGLIDGSDRWTGGSTMVVQVGDILDRGGDELKILYFLEKLKYEADKSGGKVITMNGNHEIMNVDYDFRFTSKLGLEEFRVWGDWYCVGNSMKGLCDGLALAKDPFDGVPSEFPRLKEEYCEGIRARIAALRPKGPIATRFFSKNVTVLVVGDSVFVHGGLLPRHVYYGLERINEEVRDWLSGLKEKVSLDLISGRNSVVWLRKFSHEVEENCDCSTLQHVLATIPGAKRMIMGHTIQARGINGACDNRAIRIDVGLSKGCGNGLPEVLEISGDSKLRILTSNPAYRNRYESYVKDNGKDGLGLLIPDNLPKQVEVNA
ncbi:hypothetical protein LguiA_002657 [Lonicera macranthoides]